jgi:hypothetical protein
MRNAAIEHKKARSNTGIPGVTLTKRRGRNCYSVSWRSAKRVRNCTTIYFGDSVLELERARERAIKLRQDAIAARYARESATTFRDGNNAKKGNHREQ